MATIDTTVLVERARTGDRPAYGALVERFQPTVYALALGRLGNVAEAQELTQDVFLHGMRKLDQLREPARFPGWLRQITVRMALNRLTRRKAPRPVGDEVVGFKESTEDSPLEAAVRQERCAALWAGLNRLKPLDRATLVAFYIKGLSVQEIADEFAAPLGTIKRRLHVARGRLKSELEQLGDEEDAEFPAARPGATAVA